MIDLCYLQVIKAGTMTQMDTWVAKDNHIWITGTWITQQEVGSSFEYFIPFTQRTGAKEPWDLEHDSVCFFFLLCVILGLDLISTRRPWTFGYFGKHWRADPLSCFLRFSPFLIHFPSACCFFFLLDILIYCSSSSPLPSSLSDIKQQNVFRCFF